MNIFESFKIALTSLASNKMRSLLTMLGIIIGVGAVIALQSIGEGVVQNSLNRLTANGTNPDVIVALEAVRPAEGKDAPPSWRYGVVCMTAAGVTVKLDKEEVFSKPYTKSPGDFDTWTWFLEGAPKK